MFHTNSKLLYNSMMCENKIEKNNVNNALYAVSEMYKKIDLVKKIVILAAARKIKNVYLCDIIFKCNDLEDLKFIVFYIAKSDIFNRNYYKDLIEKAEVGNDGEFKIEDGNDIIDEIGKVKWCVREGYLDYLFSHYGMIYIGVELYEMFKFCGFDSSLFYMLPLKEYRKYELDELRSVSIGVIKPVWRLPYYSNYDIKEYKPKINNEEKVNKIMSENYIELERVDIANYLLKICKIDKKNDVNVKEYAFNGGCSNKSFYKVFKILVFKFLIGDDSGINDIYIDDGTDNYKVGELKFNNNFNEISFDEGIENKITLLIKKHKREIIKLLDIWEKRINNDDKLYESVKNDILKQIDAFKDNKLN